jgi:hypothetical protein
MAFFGEGNKERSTVSNGKNQDSSYFHTNKCGEGQQPHHGFQSFLNHHSGINARDVPRSQKAYQFIHLIDSVDCGGVSWINPI